MLRNCIVFDIETGSLPIEEIEFPEFEAPSNYKNAETIAAYIDKKKAEFIDSYLHQMICYCFLWQGNGNWL